MRPEVKDALDRMFVVSTRSTPSLGRFQTLEALEALGSGWHSATEILRKMKEIGATTNTNYVYEIAVRFQELVESSDDKTRFRVRNTARTELRPTLKAYERRIIERRDSRSPEG